MNFLYQLTRPFAYLSLRGPSLGLYRIWGPTVLAFLSVIAVWTLPSGVNSVGSDSLSSFLAQLFSTLPGFYIAALAAIVAFQGGDLDKDMPGTTAVISANRDTSRVQITFRVFLCYLFSYLTILSFIGFGICVIASLLVPSVQSWCSSAPSVLVWIELVYIFLVSLMTFAIVLCTIQGLYFLAERVHQTLMPDTPDEDD